MKDIRVLIVSTHRSDRAHYAPLAKLLRADERFVVYFVGDDAIDAQMFHEYAPHVAVVLGDRYEMLQSAAKCVEARVPLLHIHGGEHTYGSLDERYRWAMTALADWHCVATDIAKTEVERNLITGEWGAGPRKGFTDTYRTTANCVVVTGAPGLDDIQERQPFEIEHPYIIVAYNPAIDAETTAREVMAIRTAIAYLPRPYWTTWVKPNGDRFSDLIPSDGPEFDSETFHDRLAAADVIVGNSSAGIIEAPSLGTWTVNVGERQAGRPRAASIIDTIGIAPEQVGEAIKYALRTPFPKDAVNPYGDGHASERIRDVLLGMMAS